MTVGKVNGGSKPAGFWMPTKEQLTKTYGGLALGAVKAGTAQQLKHAPANAEKYAHYNVTPKGLMGVGSEVYVIKGQLYLKQTPVAPHAHSTWFKCGPAPLF